MICKEIPRTKIQDIQSIVVYDRSVFDRAIGTAIELYNSDDDPNLETLLATTNIITIAVEVYSFDYPAIDIYPSGGLFYTNSITQIASETLALKEVVSEFADGANITGGLKVDTINTNDLIVNESLNVDNNIISYDSKKFNTIVLRKTSGVSGNTTFSISLIEFQVWVNSVNILPTDISSTYFSLWTDKDEDIGHYALEAPERIYDEIINDSSVSNSFGGDSNSQEVALVINLNSLINVQNLQSLILYNRISSEVRKERAIGLGIELYNRNIDPTLISPVATTIEIQPQKMYIVMTSQR